MLLIRSLVHKRGNPLDRIPPGTVGVHPFPTEVWQQIFSLATYQLESERRSEENYGDFFSDDEEYLLPISFNTRPHPRLSFALVCRSWYLMSLRILWSRIVLIARNPKQVLRVYNKLMQNPSLALYVNRITILSPYLDGKSALSTILQVIPLLINLSVVICPVNIAAALPSSLRLKMATIHDYPLHIEGDSTYVEQLQPVNLFWRHCSTLSLDVDKCFGDLQFCRSPPVTFPNLINLRLHVFSEISLNHIVSTWRTPRLKNLSIVKGHPFWVDFLRQNRLTLERIQFEDKLIFYFEASVIEMPRLVELQILYSVIDVTGPNRAWTFVIKGPNLRKCVFQIEHRHIRVQQIISTAISGFQQLNPWVKEIKILARGANWGDIYDGRPFAHLSRIDIAGWCEQGFKIEVICGEQGTRYLYTQEFVSEDASKYFGTLIFAGN